jgi:predicted metal-dependent enzyme (double-stranded beta helix superfamily)
MDLIEQFVQRVSLLRAQLDERPQLVEKVKDELLPLLDPSWLPPELLEQPRCAPLRYLLHRSAVVTVFAIASPPGFVSSIHDHGTWGVVGQVMGVEREVVYEFAQERSKAVGELVGLTEKGSAELTAGDIVGVVPPTRDVHHVATLGNSPSVSLHAFARDPMRAGFVYFAPRLYAPMRYSGRYDNESPLERVADDRGSPH